MTKQKTQSKRTSKRIRDQKKKQTRPRRRRGTRNQRKYTANKPWWYSLNDNMINAVKSFGGIRDIVARSSVSSSKIMGANLTPLFIYAAMGIAYIIDGRLRRTVHLLKSKGDWIRVDNMNNSLEISTVLWVVENDRLRRRLDLDNYTNYGLFDSVKVKVARMLKKIRGKAETGQNEYIKWELCGSRFYYSPTQKTLTRLNSWVNPFLNVPEDDDGLYETTYSVRIDDNKNISGFIDDGDDDDYTSEEFDSDSENQPSNIILPRTLPPPIESNITSEDVATMPIIQDDVSNTTTSNNTPTIRDNDTVSTISKDLTPVDQPTTPTLISPSHTFSTPINNVENDDIVSPISTPTIITPTINTSRRSITELDTQLNVVPLQEFNEIGTSRAPRNAPGGTWDGVDQVVREEDTQSLELFMLEQSITGDDSVFASIQDELNL